MVAADSALLALTNRVYDAASGAGAWSDVGRDLLGAFDAASATIMLVSRIAPDAEILFRGDLPADAVTAYNTHYRKVDLWTLRAAAAILTGADRRGPQVWRSGTLVPDSEFLRSEFYGDFGRPLGLRYVVGTVVPIDAGRMMPIGLHRPERSRPFEAGHLQLLSHLVPHLRRAMQIRALARPGAEAAAAGLAALDAIPNGVLVVDPELRVLVANAAAEAMAQGGALRLRRTRTAEARATILGATHRSDEAALIGLVRASALTGSTGGAIALRDIDGTPALAALVAPLPGRLVDATGDAGGRVPGRAIVLLRPIRTDPGQVGTEVLRDLFRLTPAEAEVARDIVGGATKRAVAAGRNARETTVRTQIRSILAKTGAANLRDLERLIAGLQ